MFQPMTECVDSLTIDDVIGQAVPESGTGRTECSVADGCKPHSRYLRVQKVEGHRSPSIPMVVAPMGPCDCAGQI